LRLRRRYLGHRLHPSVIRCPVRPLPVRPPRRRGSSPRKDASARTTWYGRRHGRGRASGMQLLYDPRDDAYHERIGSQILYWLDALGPVPLDEADPAVEGFLFAGARPIDDYRERVARLPLVRDRPGEREPLLRLDVVLRVMDEAGVQIPSPRTWVLPLDAP